MKKTKPVLSRILALPLSILMILTLTACFGWRAPRPEWSEWVDMENMEFRGISTDSSPLAATGLKLLQRERESSSGMEYEYTILGTLKKTSTAPVESFFTFDIILIDDLGRHIGTKSNSTIPGSAGDLFFTDGSTLHLEEGVSVRPSNQVPVAVEFTKITEGSKDDFIRITLDEAIYRISRDHLNDAKRRVDLVLHFDPDNEEAKALLEQIRELQEQEDDNADVVDDPPPTPESTPTPIPSPEPTPESSPTPTPSPTPEPTPSPEPDDYILTVDNNADFSTLLTTRFPSNEEIETFVERYIGRTIEFDGHIFMSSRQFHGMRETPPTSLHVFLWNGDSEDANNKGYHYGCAYFMERVRRIDFPPIIVEDTNVRVVATIDGVRHLYLDDGITILETYIVLVPISIKTR
jgi:hypothetical protein